MRRGIVLAAAAAIVMGLVSLGGVSGQSPNQPVVDWLRGRAVRLQSVEARHGFADMQPLKKIVGNARIVSLGEATHGTREFFQLKHRMLEFLATEMGFTIFSIEANMPEAYRLNDYVLTGRGDPAQLLQGMYFWTWNTEEVLDMIRWMREFNASGRGRVEFTGYDMQTPDVAAQIARDFIAKYEPGYSGSLETAWRDLKAAAQASPAGPGFGVASAVFPLDVAAGKRVHYSGYIRTEGVTRGYAGLWWRVDGEKGILAFDNMQDRAPRGTTDWTRYEISLAVPAGARNIVFGMLHPGDGTAWFDGLQVELDGVPYTNPERFDFDFESPALRGFVAGGAGYEISLDKVAARQGAQSLRSRYVGGPEAAPAPRVDLAMVTKACKEVLAHMESSESRQAWRRAGASDKDSEWAVQNARVVLQYARMNSGEQTRDRSMAENVKWILDRSPGAKIVLWAHNGHVAVGGYRGFEPMGRFLRDAYGKDMVVFGFAFNQGSFQAMEQGKGLREFTVPPAPAESLDAALAATGLPVLAVDLRQAPPTGPVAEWLSASHKTRSIGAVFNEIMASAYLMDLKAPEAYDALLFVQKTTSARKNPPIATAR
jgi:erythromycin esterase-like protein